MNGPGFLALAALLLVAGNLGLLALAGAGEEGVRLVLRSTARTSLLLFCAAFAASALQRLSPSPLSRWLLRNRRWLGLSFAVSHALHLGALVALRRLDPGFVPDASSLVFGGLAFLMIALMSATSSDAAVARLGRARWRALHRTGSWVIWAVFAGTLLPRVFESPLYLLANLALAAVLAVRVAAARKTRTAPAPA